jgi:hypothetical protein
MNGTVPEHIVRTAVSALNEVDDVDGPLDRARDFLTLLENIRGDEDFNAYFLPAITGAARRALMDLEAVTEVIKRTAEELRIGCPSIVKTEKEAEHYRAILQARKEPAE